MPDLPVSGTLSANELAALVGDAPERVAALTARGVLAPDAMGRYTPGDAHRIRVVDGFEAAGVPLDALVRAQEAGVISVAYYDELHAPLGAPSSRTYAAVRESLGSKGELLPAIFNALGMAEPDPTSSPSRDDEAFLEFLLTLVAETGEVDLMLRVLRQFGEAMRRASVATLEIYAELIDRLGPEFAGVPSREMFDRHFLPWARVARSLPAIAEWLTTKQMSREIDAYSIQSTEQLLEQSGFVPTRPGTEPAVAFLDLSGFTALAEANGDSMAAEVALTLGELASRTALGHGGRLVKLLGDGVLMRFPNVVAAVDASLELLGGLEAAGLPPGHVGVTEGPIIARDGDVFGRTVNLAARISDVAPSGALYVPVATGEALAGRFLVEAVGRVTLQGVGTVELASVRRRTDSPDER
jgi:adenylate cyclase